MTRRGWWRLSFLGLTGLVLGMEVFASVDGDLDTRPWTDEIVTYVDPEVFALGFGGLAVWVGVHFWRRYWRKHREEVDAPGG